MYYLKNHTSEYKKADLEKAFMKTIQDKNNKDQRKNKRIFVIPDIVLDDKYVIEIAVGGLTLNSSVDEKKLIEFGLELKEIFIVFFVPDDLADRCVFNIVDNQNKMPPRFKQLETKEFDLI